MQVPTHLLDRFPGGVVGVVGTGDVGDSTCDRFDAEGREEVRDRAGRSDCLDDGRIDGVAL
jgi:hypothetical protein